MARIEFSVNPTHPPKHPHPQRPPPSDRDETRNSSVDYISELPVAIILHIFSFLTTKDAIKTSVLSKRWRSTWTANPHISFSMPECDNRSMFRSFMAIVDAVLLRCTAIKVKSFLFYAPRLDCLIESSHTGWLRSVAGPTIDSWLRFAVEHDIEEVSMTLRNDNFYGIPKFFFRCTTLVSFHVSRCRFSTMAAVNWSSLKRLRIDDAKLEDNVIMRILKGCPVLEELVIHFPKFVHHRDSILSLPRGNIDTSPEDSILKISAPHLLKLRILGSLQSCQGTSPEYVSCREIGNGELVSSADHEGALGIAKILESSSRLEKLFLQMTCKPSFPFVGENVGRGNLEAEEFRNSTKWRIHQCLMHLKNVEIVDPGANWLAWEPVLSMLKFLLQKAPSLDNIEIN
ncbi:hypothetical protein EUGRSUZ_C04095, partial [Eucalyptus grandis]